MATSSRGSNRSRRSSRGGMDGLKSSPIVAVIAVLLIVIAMWKLYQNMNPEQGQFTLHNFPFYFTAVGNAEEYDKGVKEGFTLEMIRYDNDKRPQLPMDRNGLWMWDVRECKNTACPYLVNEQKDVPEADRKTFKFPNVRREDIAARIEWATAGYPSYSQESEEEPTPEQVEQRNKHEELMMARALCPWCLSDRRIKEEDMNVDDYLDEEGRKMQAELNERILEFTKRK